MENGLAEQHKRFRAAVLKRINLIYPNGKTKITKSYNDPNLFAKVIFSTKDDIVQVMQKLLRDYEFLFIRNLEEVRGPYANKYIQIYKLSKTQITKNVNRYEFFLIKENVEKFVT